jgi:hypothetical protein
VGTSHSRAVLSWLPVSSVLPSGLKATLKTASATFICQGNNVLNGSIAAGETVVVRSTSSASTLTVGGGATNVGTILLETPNAGLIGTASLALPSVGTFTNVGGGLIQGGAGAARGTRLVTGNLTNQGWVDVVTGSSLTVTAT